MPVDPIPDDSNSIDIDLDIDLDIDNGQSEQAKVTEGTIESGSKQIDTAQNRTQGSTHVSGRVIGRLTVEAGTVGMSEAAIAESISHTTVHAVSSTTLLNHIPTTYIAERKTTHRQRPGIYQIGSATLGGISVGTIVGAAIGGPFGAIVGAATVAGVSAVSALNSKLNS